MPMIWLYARKNSKLQTPDANDLALRAQNFKIADSRCRTSASRAQKPRFCARKARKRGFRRQKAHKNVDFVLEKPENGGSEGKKRTTTSILCSKSPKTGVPRAKKHKNADFVLGEANIREKLTEACGFCALFADRTKMDIFVLTELIVWSNVVYGICEDYKR